MRINLAAALSKIGRSAEALRHLTDALFLKGDIPELHNNMWATLEALDRYREAAAAFRNALKLRPDYPEAHFNLANALRKQGKHQEAIDAYQQALRLKPDYAHPLYNMAQSLGELADLQGVIACYRKVVELEPRHATAHGSLLYTLHYHPDYGPAELFREHVEWGRRHAEPLRSRIRPHLNDRSDPQRRLRLGYVSPDFREHTVPRFITAALAHHDRERFEIFCYSGTISKELDAVTDQLRKYADHWRDIASMPDSQAENLIRGDQIDILVDLRGHAGGDRMLLFARKPAPVQINMVGYFDTTGLPTMDYRITDSVQDPPGQTEGFHVEKLIRIDPSCWCYTPDHKPPDVAEPPSLRAGHVTFGTLNKIIKISPPCARLWGRVLEKVAGSRLLVSVAGADPGGVVRDRLAAMGLPVDRVDIVDKTPTRRRYLERFHEIDVALDTTPFNGITTTCDGLWMGVPCVSRSGDTSVSRAGRSILEAAGLGELACDTDEQFVRVAADLARDPDGLRSRRLAMRESLLASPLTAHRRFARSLEAEFRRVWLDWCARTP
jgi:predicted O-linked N-acetylglucosamine transferase (SPINDLY family)